MRIKPPIRTLSASRAFGDWDLAKYIKPIPSITRYALKDTDKSLVLACDGFWDEMNTNSEPFDHIKNFEYIEEKSNTLVAYALYKRSQDNITIIIIDIQKLRGKLN